MTLNCCSKEQNKGRNRRKNNNNNDDYDFDDEDKEQINSIVCKKSMVFIFNIFFFLSGIALAGFGIYTLKVKHEYISLLTSVLYEASTYIIIIAGCIIVITALLGVIGAWIGSKKILIAYVILLAIILISEVLAGALAITYRARLKESLKQDLDLLVKEQYFQPGYDKKTQSFDNLQIKFKCCGAINYHDWKNSTYIMKQQQQQQESTINNFNLVAESCCKTPSKLCAVSDHPSNINYNGCVDALENSIKDFILILGIVGCTICFIQALGIVFSILLIKQLKKCSLYTNVKANDY